MSRIERPKTALTTSFCHLDKQFLGRVQGNLKNDRERRDRQAKIERENRILLQRLEDQKPNYSQTLWMTQERLNLKYLENMSRFPEIYSEQLLRLDAPTRPSLTRKTDEAALPPTSKTTLKTRVLKIKLNRSAKLLQQSLVLKKQQALEKEWLLTGGRAGGLSKRPTVS